MYLIIIPQVRDGAGRHIEYIPSQDMLMSGLHLNFATQPTCVIALALAKISVGFFLLRISPSKFFTRVICGLMIVTALASIAAVRKFFFRKGKEREREREKKMKKADSPKTSVNIILQCRPLEFVWNKALPGGECLSVQDLVFSSYFNSAISILTDMILALLPVPMLWRVQMNRRVKASVAGILSLGLFTVAAAFVKVYYIGDWGKLGDPSWESTDITIWFVFKSAPQPFFPFFF